MPRKEYQGVHDEVSAFINAHLDHGGIVAALKWVTAWMVGSFNGDSSLPAHRDMARLHNQCVAPVAILIAAAAVWVYAQRRPARLPDDLRLSYAISLAILSLAPRERRTVAASGTKPKHDYRVQLSAVARRDIGGRLRRSLVSLFVGINEEINYEEQQRRNDQDALRMPFNRNTTTKPPQGNK